MLPDVRSQLWSRFRKLFEEFLSPFNLGIESPPQARNAAFKERDFGQKFVLRGVMIANNGNQRRSFSTFLATS